MKPFAEIYQQGLDRFGSEQALQAALPSPLSKQALVKADDSYYLSILCRRVFRAGLKHSLVDAKWPAFEQAFYQFHPRRVAMMSDEALDQRMGNTELIRHWGKIKSVRHNATMLLEIMEAYDSVGQWLAQWPEQEIIGLWQYLKKQGSQLGGNSGPYFLRMAGKDTFLLTDDVVAALKAQGIVDKVPTSQRDLKRVQDAFNHWRAESGMALCQISRLLSLGVNY